MGAEARSLDRGAQEGAGRALAVGAGDVEDGRERPLRIAEPGEEFGDALQPENVAAGRERRQPVELGLDGGMIGDRAVGQGQAASRRGLR